MAFSITLGSKEKLENIAKLNFNRHLTYKCLQDTGKALLKGNIIALEC